LKIHKDLLYMILNHSLINGRGCDCSHGLGKEQLLAQRPSI
jgi:hypothetical protein